MKKLMLTVLGVVGILFSSCLHDSTEVPPVPTGNALKLRVKTEDVHSGGTRATVNAEYGEEVVKSLYLLFFDPSSDRSGGYNGYYPIENVTMNTDIELPDMGSHDLLSSSAYKILAVANLDRYEPYLGGATIEEWLSALGGKTESNVYNQMRAFILTNRLIAADGILMTGEANKPEGSLVTIDLTLTRNVVRFDVVNNARTNYDLVSVSIWNAFPETSMFGGGVLDYSNTTRIRKFYGIENTSHADIYGGLYTFPNQVSNPGEKDQKTTCLIVGLAAVGGGATTYHRVNISDEESMQDIKRNNVYRLTINSVGGDGADDEEAAYTGGVSKLNSRINFWGLDDDGLIKQDGEVILAIPTKRIRFGAEEDERTYDIFAFGGPQGEQIAVSTSFEGTSGNYIKVGKNGNTITVKAEELTMNSNERAGTITVSYAGLSATISITQSGTMAHFLRVTTPGGVAIPSFSPFGDQGMIGDITVESSSAWTAKVYCLDTPGYFGIVEAADPSTYSPPVWALTDKFKMKTIATNDENVPRQAFVLISLDADPFNYNTALILTQRAQSNIGLEPAINQVVWDAVGKLSTAGGISEDEYKFLVHATIDEGVYPQWTAEILPDDANFEIVDHHYSGSVQNDNYVTVRAKSDINVSGSNYVAKLRVSLTPDIYADVNLLHRVAEWKLPVTPPAITAAGGESPELLLDASEGMHYTVEIESLSGATDHFAYVVDTDEPANKYSKLKSRPVGKPFKVGFPKLIYPNLNSSVSATVKVTVTESGESKTFTITQNPPVQYRVNILNVNDSWGRLSNANNNSNWNAEWNPSYNEAWVNSFRSSGNFGTSGTVKTNGSLRLSSTSFSNFSHVWDAVEDDVRFVHVTRPGDLNTDAARNADAEVWRWITTPSSGVVFINTEGGSAEAGRDFSDRIPGRMGLSGSGSYNATYSMSASMPANGTGRVMDYVKAGPFGNQSARTWSTGGTTSRINLSSVTGEMVPVLVNGSYCALVIDPRRRIVVKVDSEMFDSAAEMSALPKNVQAWVINTAQYGSHFSEYFWDSPRYLMTAPTPQQP